MKAWVSAFFVLSFLLPMNSLPAMDLKYEDIPGLIRKNNKGVKASEESIELSKMRSGSLERSFFPRFGFETGVRGQNEADGSGDTAPFWKVDIQSNIYRGGRDQHRRSVLGRQHELKSYDAQAFYRNEVLKARQEYIRLAGNQELLRLAKSVREERVKKKRSIQRKVQAGILTESDTALVGIFESEIDREILLLEKEQHEIEDRLVLTLGLQPRTELELSSGTVRLDAPKSDDSDQVAELQRLKLQSELLRSESEVKSEWWRPDVDVFASYVKTAVGEKSEPGSLPERETAIGIRFTLNLQDSAEIRSETAARLREANLWDLQREQMKSEIDYQIHEYKHEVETLTKYHQTLKQQQRDSERFQRRIDDEFERGVRDSSDIMDAVRSIYELKRKLAETSIAISLARAGLQTLLEKTP
jgi:outer membrane protein TolC